MKFQTLFEYYEYEKQNNLDEDNPVFLCHWDGSFADTRPMYVTVDEFTDTGYDDEEIEELKELDVGEVWTSHDYSYHHMILRVQ